MVQLIGQSFGQYRILEQLGEGGMASVYKAHDTQKDLTVAVKIIRAEELPPKVLQRAYKRFEREAIFLSQLNHPNIVRLLDYGQYAGQPYMAMEYMPNGTLKQRLTGKPISWKEAVQFLTPIAHALEFSHERGLIHRDVKPSNILINGNWKPVLSDFGIVKVLNEETSQDLTTTGIVVGTPEYISPEQAMGLPYDRRADIYSFSIVIYEMITGRKPFRANTPVALLVKQANEPLPPASQFVSGLPDSIDRILMKALAKEPEMRFQSVRALFEELESLLVAPKSFIPQNDSKHLQQPPSAATTDQLKIPFSIGQQKIQRALGNQNVPPQSARKKRKWILPVTLLAVLTAIFSLGTSLLSIGKEQTAQMTDEPSVSPLQTEVRATDIQPTVSSTAPVTQTPTEFHTPTPSLDIGSTLIREKDQMVMAYVPEGEFIMGNDAGDPDEMPVHTVYLDAFWIDQTEITNAMYQICVTEGSCQPPVQPSSRYSKPEYVSFPVVNVRWEDASAYCQWAGGHLPTEAQWEKAARGTDGRTYPWGEEINKTFANYYSSGVVQVKSFPAGVSPYGLFDMSGNAWEWVADWYDAGYYSVAPKERPTGPSSGQQHVLRGGSWYNPSSFMRATDRFVPGSNISDYGPGFRCTQGL